LIAGRDLTWEDLYEKRLVALVSENTARELWRDPAGAIGKRIREGMKDSWREIVGVVVDVRHDGADHEAPATVYWPLMMSDFYGESTFLQRGVVYTVRGKAGCPKCGRNPALQT
jgi:putative ABC transport system permease protein